ncbi:MAG: M1 family metallopeptidase, partial [Bacteroidota bacterium]
MIRYRIFIVFIFFSASAFAQSGNDFYRSNENTLYWKSRKPYPGYWQQDVHYDIKAEIDDELDIISGKENLTYWNNSTDTLAFVYFHLYQNAFQPESYFDMLMLANEVKANYKRWEKEKKGMVIEKIQSGGVDLNTVPDNTILKVYLIKPMLPGDSVIFNIDFKSYYGNSGLRRRMQLFTSWGHKHYNGAQWYPKISVYDSKFGWTADQHLSKEFYGDFGSFDVELTFPNIYIVEATGVLQNEKEVLPDSLRKALDISNFKDKPFGFPPSLPIMPDDSKKTWKFHADNVHDFAFTADPTYRFGEVVSANGIRCIALVQESHASGWQNAAEYTARVIEYYSATIGMYAWPKIVVCDAQDGMEYPMLTMDAGSDPGYRDLLAHEIAHQWFYGMVGNNETYRALLDEGFSQFIESECLDQLEGHWGLNPKNKNMYQEYFRDSISISYRFAQSNYLVDAIRNKDGFLNTHSDHFNSALGHGGGYSMVYRKTAVMLFNLQYVLGDSLFRSALRHYFDQWKFCHPYPEDFRNSFIQFTHVDLNWFFDEWLETDYKVDYKLKSISKGAGEDDFVISFLRKERMEMPLDFSVYSNEGKTYNYHIPNRNFIKQTDAIVLPKWYGWDKLNPVYDATIHIPSGIERIMIDTTLRLADINMLNNSRPFPLLLKFDSRVANPADWNHYVVKWRPDIWFNNYDGIKAGIHLEGNYFNYSRFFDFNFWMNTGLAQQKIPEFAAVNKNDPVSVTFSFKTPLEDFIKNSNIQFNSRIIDGLQHFNGGVDWNTMSRQTNIAVSFSSDYRNSLSSLAYLLYPDEWGIGRYDNALTASLTHSYKAKGGNGVINLSLRSSSIGSNYDYSYLRLTVVDNYYFGKFTLRSRAIGQLGTGTDFAKESSLYLAGANGEELMNDKFTRSRAFVPEDWLGYGVAINHFQQGGGLNLRGYAGYLTAQEKGKGTVRTIYRGTTGWAFNEELDFTKYIPFKPKFTRTWLSVNMYLFGDAGSINYDLPEEKILMSDVRADAGIGIGATIKKFFSLQT